MMLSSAGAATDCIKTKRKRPWWSERVDEANKCRRYDWIRQDPAPSIFVVRKKFPHLQSYKWVSFSTLALPMSHL